ncbi:MAG: DnaJ domain-containing protein [Chloroflexota bacterium]|nr:DnaJ domain-containing protein [Chloroflexota bacterium]
MTTASTDERRAGGPLTLYTVLGISSDSDPEAIRDAYRRLARRFHPDTGGDAHSMSLINKAWAELGDPERRAAYDRTLGIEQPGEGAVEPDPPEPEPGSLATRMATRMANATGTGTVLDFGRYEGWSIDQLAKHDPDYLLWLERTSIGRPLQGEIQAVLADRG